MNRRTQLVFGLLAVFVAFLVTPTLVPLDTTATTAPPDNVAYVTGLAHTDDYNAEMPQVTADRMVAVNSGDSFLARTGRDTNTARDAFTNNRLRDDEGRAARTNPSVMAWRSKSATLVNIGAANAPNTATACAVNTKVQRTIDDEGRVNNGPMRCVVATTNGTFCCANPAS